MRAFHAATGLMLELPKVPSIEATRQESALARVLGQIEGERVNQSQDRRVGHDWLRAPALAPTQEITAAILNSHAQIDALAPAPDHTLLLIGIGGSALGMQLVARALLSNPQQLQSLDNGDPQGIQDTLARIDPARTQVLVVTKSGTTGETLAALSAAQAHWQKAGLRFADYAIAVTQDGTPLHTQAQSWRACLPLWPWVGGRFCVTSCAGLAAMQLLGLSWRDLLAGAAAMDAWTHPALLHNPALALAKHWYVGQSTDQIQAVAVLAYRDRLALAGRYIQQLVMESLGKSTDLFGAPVQQGLCVLGERGSTDQHSIVQYLAQGRNNAFSLVIDTRELPSHQDPLMSRIASEHMARALGTYQTLFAHQRPCALLSLPDLSAKSMGAMVSFFERCIGYYAGLASINAYDQPGVKAGKEAADVMSKHLTKVAAKLGEDWQDCELLAAACGLELGITWRLAMHLVNAGKAKHRLHEDVARHAFCRA